MTGVKKRINKMLYQSIIGLGNYRHQDWLLENGNRNIKKFFKDFIDLRECVNAQAGGESEGEGETDSPLSREPNTELNSRTPRSWPKPKSDI